MTDKKSKGRRKSAWELVIAKNRARVVEMYSRGATKTKLAEFLGISLKTFLENEKAHPDFAAELVSARMVALDEVRGALFRRAVGYKVEKTSMRKVNGVETRFIEKVEVPADVAACLAILKNAGEWSDNPVVDNAVAQALTDDEKRERACRILGIPNTGPKSTSADDFENWKEREERSR